MLLFVKGLTRSSSMERREMDIGSAEDMREFRRIVHSEPVHYRFNDSSRFGGCVARDLSEGGIRVRLNDFVPLNTRLTLSIPLTKDNVVECAGRVVWVEKSRFGEYYQAGLDISDDEAALVNQKKIYGFLSHQ
jgi:hypothetical protein